MMTMAEVAKALGMSERAVKRTEQRALRKLRAAMKARGLTYQDLTSDPRQGHPLASVRSA